MFEGGGYHKLTLSQINSYDAWNKSLIIQYDVFAQVSGAFRDSPIWDWFTRAPGCPPVSTCYAILAFGTFWLHGGKRAESTAPELLNTLSVYIHVKCSELNWGHFSTEQQAFKNDS